MKEMNKEVLRKLINKRVNRKKKRKINYENKIMATNKHRMNN